MFKLTFILFFLGSVLSSQALAATTLDQFTVKVKAWNDKSLATIEKNLKDKMTALQKSNSKNKGNSAAEFNKEASLARSNVAQLYDMKIACFKKSKNDSCETNPYQ